MLVGGRYVETITKGEEMSNLRVAKHYDAADPDRVVRVLRSAGVSCWTENDGGKTVVVLKDNENCSRDDMSWFELGFMAYAADVDFKLYEHDGKFWFDILDFNIEGDELPTLIQCSEQGWKREETAKRHAKQAVEELRRRLVEGVSFVDWN